MNGLETVFSSKVMAILEQPTSIFALLGLLLLILAFGYIKNIRMNTRMLVFMGLMIALASVLHLFRLYQMPQGGSVTLGAMIPLLLIAWRYGPIGGYLAGFVYGLINLIQNPYILHPVQVLFDYPLPYMALGLAGHFRDRILLGAIVGISARFVCHLISGVAFFASYAPIGVSPYWYSMVFNATYLIPELIICLVILSVLPVKRMLFQMRQGENRFYSYRR